MKTNLLALVVTLTVGIILAGSLMVPVIEDAQTDIGDPITKVNNTTVLLRPVEEGDTLEATFADGKWTWTLNDTVIQGIGNNSITWDSFIISDAMYLSNRSAGDNWAATISIFSINPTVWSGFISKTSAGADSSVVFSNGEITITGDNSNIFEGSTTIPYTWAYVVCPEVEATYCAAVSGGTAYVKSTDDLILCGTYSTGENDCAYTYKNGTSTVIGGDFTMTVNQATTVANGTTDIYEDTVSVDIDDENFTPFRIFVPYEVDGHATAGAAYSLLGAIPLIVIIGLVLAGMGAIFVRNRD